jgi:MoaA/NifB/PqqE/SkfB family radical SAM enzyme
VVNLSRNQTLRDRMSIVVETNGQRLSDLDYAKALREAGADEIVIGLHASNAATSDALTRTPGGFDKTVQAIHNCLELGITTHLQCVVERDNLQDLPGHARFIAEEIADKHPEHSLVKVTYIIPIPFADEERFRTNQVTRDALDPSLPSIREALERRGIRVVIQDS